MALPASGQTRRRRRLFAVEYADAPGVTLLVTTDHPPSDGVGREGQAGTAVRHNPGDPAHPLCGLDSNDSRLPVPSRHVYGFTPAP